MRSSSYCCWTSSSSDGSRGYGPARWFGGSSPSSHSWMVRREQRVYECLKYSVMLQEVIIMVVLWYPFYSFTLHFNTILSMLLCYWNYCIVHSVIIYALSCCSMSLDLSFQVLISKCSLNSFTFSLNGCQIIWREVQDIQSDGPPLCTLTSTLPAPHPGHCIGHSETSDWSICPSVYWWKGMSLLLDQARKPSHLSEASR